ncbi:hypothetical protein UA08_06691 [Talaromyces atroroseus]|uniref:Uncharacterized protein n=1 Tax=Talaromyces atroroseus TaxID=1441469 RepID=A0A225AUB6_TALAT|nr:hypothetical protein UA08_06691 [Talaromyces atroroseus]OKL58005.1 hypothetical protein UA08_06691 [Talaromyces atroroseus]
MAGAGSPSLLVADVHSTAQSVDEIKEYEKILKISHDIFAGTHPRLKVPEQFICKAPSRTLQSSIAPTSLENAGPHQARATPAAPLPTESRVPHIKPTSSSVASSIGPKSTSGIDPIFLTKSDDLVRAEIQLQRKRIENALKEQAERSKFDTRQRTAAHEGRPDVDVSDVLNQALEIVKPFPSPDISGTNDAMIPSDSVDENSLYSSRAPDSPLTWDYEKHTLTELDRQGRGLAEREKTAHHIDARRVAEIDPHTLQGTTDQAILPQGLNQPTRGKKHKQQQQQEELLLDEPEYSPPEPTVPMVDNRGDDEYQPPEVIDSARQNTLRQVGQGLAQQSPNVRVVRNHITSPAAPQPSRVSPLATAKGPSVQRMLHTTSAPRDYSEGGPSELYSGQTSPEGPPSQQLLPRKRRRVQEPRETAGMRIVDTPEPHIKLEPVSPPPFHDTASRPYLSSERPVYIDISSPRYASSTERREVISKEPAYELDRYGSSGHEFDSAAEASVRAVSRLSVRRPMRDSQDLRRVASLHNARNPDNTSREFIEPVIRPQSARASPYLVVERQPSEKPAYYEDVAPTYSRRYAHYDEYPLPSRYREYYVEDDAGRRFVEPGPARRIVVDEYGNQYYEMVPASKVRPTPSIPARVVRPDEYAERAYVRSGSIRGASIVEDGYGNRRYIQEMAPPPTGTYRRVAEHGRNAGESQRLYPSRAVESAFRSGSVAVDYAPRQATYIEEEIPRDRLVRTSSVRPPPSRYEQHRVQSVRPTGREMSVYMDEDSHSVAREYSERPGYTAVRPEREGRYITDEDGTRLAIDGARDVVHRVVPRY